jgi:hypothetical protein
MMPKAEPPKVSYHLHEKGIHKRKIKQFLKEGVMGSTVSCACHTERLDLLEAVREGEKERGRKHIFN